ncbi:putative membrane protein [Brevundimonas vesicularis]|uniref:Putative membrane protein n=1 Tax=Brevundimonas vesicularis TaxID=41276 RepID=A0A7W9L5U4_BREVE|nr:hypothetical protein [Brevundimonas vesicularis]MBB5771715.1 putative membrane protein [Brevundimonas vesicularis]
MAEPGDPKDPAAPRDHDHDHDAEVGFVSPASLAGRARDRQPGPFPSDEPEPDLFDPPELAPGPFDRSGPVTRPTAPFPPRSEAKPAEAEPAPAVRAVRQRLTAETAPRREGPVVPMRLYAVYVLILLAVPTLGVSCLVALLAVMRRDGAMDPLEHSHAVYQQRTIVGAVGAAVVGALLIVVNIGVLVLFALAIWVLARGVFGVLKLKSGQAVPHPRSLLF